MTAAVVTTGLTKNFGDICAVSDLHLSVRRGETLCLLGPNGAGKSTTLNMMLGLSRPSSGSVRIFGHVPESTAARQAIGYVSQECDFPSNLTTLEILRLVQCHYPEPLSLESVIENFGLETLIDRQTGGLSGGQKRKLSLALAFVGRGQVIFLDEPTTGLDAASRKGFWAYARGYVQDGGTLVLTTHHLDEVETIADRICLIDHGCIRLEGSVDEIRSRIAQKTVRFLCRELPDLAPVSNIEASDGVVRIVSPDADEIVRQLVASRVAFSGLEITGVSLEEAIERLAPGAGEKVE